MVSECAPTRRLPSTSPSLPGWPVEGGEKRTGAATTIVGLGGYSGFTCVMQMERDFLAFKILVWLALWPSWCYTGGPSRCQTTSPEALGGWSIRHH